MAVRLKAIGQASAKGVLVEVEVGRHGRRRAEVNAVASAVSLFRTGTISFGSNDAPKLVKSTEDD